MAFSLFAVVVTACRLEPIENPFGPKVLPMYSAVSVKVVVAMVMRSQGRGGSTALACVATKSVAIERRFICARVSNLIRTITTLTPTTGSSTN